MHAFLLSISLEVELLGCKCAYVQLSEIQAFFTSSWVILMHSEG